MHTGIPICELIRHCFFHIYIAHLLIDGHMLIHASTITCILLKYIIIQHREIYRQSHSASQNYCQCDYLNHFPKQSGTIGPGEDSGNAGEIPTLPDTPSRIKHCLGDSLTPRQKKSGIVLNSRVQ